MAVLPFAAIHGERPSVGDTEATLKKWVETRQLISEIQTEWMAEKEILAAESALLRQQIESLEQDITRLENATTSAQMELRELTEKRDTLLHQKTHFETVLQPLASKLFAVMQRLPKPLLEELDALQGLVAAKATKKHPASDQLVAVLGILRQADRFNRRVTLRKEVQSITEGNRVQVETLYWGLAFAFSGDHSGRIANFGFPAEQSWTFQTANEHARATRELLDTAAGKTEEVRFIPLPIELK